MFFVQQQHKTRKRDFALIHIGPTLIVFLAFFGLTIWSARDAGATLEANLAQVLDRNLRQTEAGITGSLSSYEDVMHAGAGLFYGSDQVTRKDWSEFSNVFSLEKRYPGMQSVGYAKVLSGADVVSYSDAVRASDLATFTITPDPNKPAVASVVYIEPMTESNKKVIGYDFSSKAISETALNAARDSGVIAQTDLQTFAQTNTSPTQSGFLLYLPIYRSSRTPATLTDRKQALTGYIFAQFRGHDFIHQLDPGSDQNYGFELYDTKIEAKSLLYKSSTLDRIVRSKVTETATRTFYVNNRAWILRASIDPKIVTNMERNKPVSVFWGGILFSIAVAGCIYLLLLNRTNALAQKEASDIQAAKDELLALASHQLRTPATGVKQYVGMLRDGYAGELTAEQSTYVEKAYSSNERQLRTINEMLFVAKADAGNFELNISKLNITEVLRDLIDEQTQSLNIRDQTISTDIPKTEIIIDADPAYVRMAIENILSNATKYTPEGGDIDVRLLERGKNVEIVIQDTGVGIEEKDYPLLFQKFSRIPNQLTGKVSGSGIGLYLARKILDAHSGSIQFSSQVGVGSSFKIVLPSKHKKV